MDRKKLNEILDKHIQKFFAKAPTARFDDVPNETFIDAMEEAINYTHCCKSEAELLSCKCGLLKREQGIGFSCMRTDCDANTTT